MKRKVLCNYLRTERRRWALQQKTVAYLIGFKGCTRLSKYEQRRRLPSLRTAFACQVIFGKPLSQIFKGTYDEVEEEVMQRAARLYERFEHRTDASGRRKLRFLKEMVERAAKKPN